MDFIYSIHIIQVSLYNLLDINVFPMFAKANAMLTITFPDVVTDSKMSMPTWFLSICEAVPLVIGSGRGGGGGGIRRERTRR